MKCHRFKIGLTVTERIRYHVTDLEGEKMEIAPRITIDKCVRFGKPVVAGTRVPVDLVLGKLAGGMSYEEVIEEYGLTQEDVLAVLAFAAQTLSGEEIKATG